MSKKNPLNITKLHNEVTKKYLEEYGKWTFNRTQEAIQIVTVGGVQYAMGFQEVCEDALRLIELNELHALKYEILVGKIKEFGYDGFYEHVMGQPISEALLK